MHRRLFLVLPLAGLAIAGFRGRSPMASQTGGWSVVVATNAFVASGARAPSPLEMGASIGAGDRLSTGVGGALILSRGEDLVTMAENSRIDIVDPQPLATTLIAQPYGQVEYQVTKEKVPHFQVDAPLLATVVKGTTFTVDASPSQSSVSVSEGRVVARNRLSGASAAVGAGQRGAVGGNSRSVSVGAAPSAGSKAKAAAPASNAESVSGNSSGAGSSGGKGNGDNKGGAGGKGNGGSKEIGRAHV